MSAILIKPGSHSGETAHRRRFRADVLDGLMGSPKTLPCKYFYDARGSHLFDEICDLEEYYPTRTELQILEDHVPEMAACLGRNGLIVEFGSGSSTKTRLLLDHVCQPAGYVPIDISRDHLLASAEALRKRYPGLEVLPMDQDFTAAIGLPETRRGVDKCVVYFPGSTISNFGPEEAANLLNHIARLVGRGGGLLIGIDLKKDPAIIEPAYNDARGVTAKFNLNLLVRINRELGADFDIPSFRHQAIYNADMGRIEMYLISKVDQLVHLDGHTIPFDEEERICTEYSYKFTIPGFQELADRAGFQVNRTWSDKRNLFSVLFLTLA